MLATYDVVQQRSEGSCGSTVFALWLLCNILWTCFAACLWRTCTLWGNLSHIMLANSHCAKKTNYHFKTNKLPVLMNNPWLLLTLLSDCEFPAALVGSGARWSTSEIYHLEVYMAFSPGIHSFWQYLAFFHVLWHSIWHSIWRLYWHTFCMVFILSFFQAFYLGSILTFYLSGIFSGVHSGRILTFFLAHVSGT